MKLLVVCCLFTFASSNAFASGTTVQGENYLTHCDQLMGLLQKEAKAGATEKAFVATADTPGKMLQLMYDYRVVFSKPFQDIVLSEFLRIASNKSSFRGIMGLHRINNMSSSKFNRWLWERVEQSVLMRSEAEKTSEGQVSFLQGQQFLKALKESPHRPLFENIAGLYTRHLLIRFTAGVVGTEYGNSAINSLVRRRTLRFRSLFSAGGIFLGAGISWFAGAPPETVGFLGGMAGGLGWLVGAVFSSELSSSDRWFSALHSLHIKHRAGESELDFTVINSLGQSMQLIEDKLIDEAKAVSGPSLISLGDACKSPTCRLSPVQIAYLGHVDTLELEALNLAIKESMKSGSFTKRLDELAVTARAVYDNPTDYENQLSLELTLKELLAEASRTLQDRRTAANNLTAYADAVSMTTIEALRQKPYKEKPQSRSELPKYKLMAARVGQDLEALSQVKVNSEAIRAKLDRTEQVIAKLSELLQQMPKGPQGWKEAASEVIEALDELR